MLWSVQQDILTVACLPEVLLYFFFFFFFCICKVFFHIWENCVLFSRWQRFITCGMVMANIRGSLLWVHTEKTTESLGLLNYALVEKDSRYTPSKSELSSSIFQWYFSHICLYENSIFFFIQNDCILSHCMWGRNGQYNSPAFFGFVHKNLKAVDLWK